MISFFAWARGLLWFRSLLHRKCLPLIAPLPRPLHLFESRGFVGFGSFRFLIWGLLEIDGEEGQLLFY